MKHTKHYWDIHRRVSAVVWGELPDYLKSLIASDVNHETKHYNAFIEKVNSETARMYEDPDYHYTKRCFPDRWERLADDYRF